MARLNIPQSLKPVLLKLARLPEPIAAQLITTVSGIAPTLDHKKLTDQVVASLNPLGADEATAITHTILTLASAMVANSVDVPDFVAEVRSAMGSPKLLSGPGAEEPGPEVVSKLGDRLSSLLKSRGLILAMKASLLQREHTNVLIGAKVITDIRPVFHDTPNAAVTTVMVHQLKLSYIHDNSPHEIYVAMDNSDLSTLKKSIIRAEEKAKALAPIMVSNGLIDLDSKGQSE